MKIFVKIVFIFFFILNNLFLFGQTHLGCGNDIGNTKSKALQCTGASSDYSNKYKHKEQYIPQHGSNDIVKTLHININIWQRQNGTGNLFNTPETIARLKQIGIWINNKYQYVYNPTSPTVSYSTELISDSKIRIVLDSIYFYTDPSNDSAYYYGGNGYATYGHNVLLDNYIKTNFPERVRALNIHLTGSEWANVGGYSVYGSIESFYRRDPDMSTSTVHDYWFASHWAHEIGHSFDLWHTYNVGWAQNCYENYSDFLWDIYDTTSNCASGCDVCLIPSDSNNNNLMGGNNNIHISALQMGIIHRSTVMENFHNINYGLRDHITGFSLTPFEVQGNETWDFSMKFYQNIIVKSGYTLTIKCETQFVPNAKIIIEPGAKLIIDGGTLTNEKYYNSIWKGIEVWGTATKSQITPDNVYQGSVEIINGGTIENAEVGVYVGKRDTLGMQVYNTGGGLVKAKNAVFKNNKTGVVMIPFHNYLPSNPTTQKPNFSYFTNCTFETNSSWNMPNTYPDAFVKLYEVDGIVFSGCTFINSAPANFAVYNRGKGIVGEDAFFIFNQYCASLTNPCTNLISTSFTNLYYAVDAKKINFDNTLSITKSVFNSNYRGVYISGILTPTITDNTFSIPDFDPNITTALPTDNNPYGLYLNGSTGYKVEDNTFNSATANKSTKYGAIINGSGAANNRIYRNIFTNLYIGSAAQGINRGSGTGLVFKCNEYTNCSRDINLAYVIRFAGSASLYQGSLTEPAANL